MNKDKYYIFFNVIKKIEWYHKFVKDYLSMAGLNNKKIGMADEWESIIEHDGYALQLCKTLKIARLQDLDKNITLSWGDDEEFLDLIDTLCTPWDICKIGDVLSVKRKIVGLEAYAHFAIYIGKGEVVHFAGKNGDFKFVDLFDKKKKKEQISIHKAPFSDFILNDESFNKIKFYEDKKYIEIYNIDIKKSSVIHNQKKRNTIVDDISELFSDFEFNIYSPEETVQRALEQDGRETVKDSNNKNLNGKDAYDLIVNNCESFALWCKTGIPRSSQVNEKINNFLIGEIAIEASKKVAMGKVHMDMIAMKTARNSLTGNLLKNAAMGVVVTPPAFGGVALLGTIGTCVLTVAAGVGIAKGISKEVKKKDKKR